MIRNLNAKIFLSLSLECKFSDIFMHSFENKSLLSDLQAELEGRICVIV